MRSGLAAFLSIAVALVATPAQAGLIVKQRANGVPGRAGADAVVSYDLYVGERAIRLEERRDGGITTIIRLDQEKIYDLDPVRKEYTVQSFDYFRRQREKAEADREDARKAILERFPADQQDAELARKGLRRDGKRVVDVRPPAPGGQINGWNTRLTEIFVNGQRALAIYATDEIEGYQPPKIMYEFWEKAQLFPKEVTEKLKEIRGFPVRIHAAIDFGDKGATIQSTVERDGVAEWPERASAFQVPAGYREVPRLTRGDATVEASVKLTCIHCGKEIVDRGSAVPVIGERDVYACSDDHMREYIMGRTK